MKSDFLFSAMDVEVNTKTPNPFIIDRA